MQVHACSALWLFCPDENSLLLGEKVFMAILDESSLNIVLFCYVLGE